MRSRPWRPLCSEWDFFPTFDLKDDSINISQSNNVNYQVTFLTGKQSEENIVDDLEDDDDEDEDEIAPPDEKRQKTW